MGRDRRYTSSRSLYVVAAAGLVGLLATTGQPAPAQEIGAGCDFCLETGGTFGAIIGEDFQGRERGPGMELILRRTWDSGWGIGLGGRLSLLETHPPSGAGSDVDVRGVFVEPRFTMQTTSALRPFVGGRLEVQRLEEPLRTDTGFQAGLVGGLDYQIGGFVTLTTSLHASTMWFRSGRRGAGREIRGGLRFRF